MFIVIQKGLQILEVFFWVYRLHSSCKEETFNIEISLNYQKVMHLAYFILI